MDRGPNQERHQDRQKDHKENKTDEKSGQNLRT